MEGELATLIGQFHHIDADVLEKISPDEMAAILSSSEFQCDEEIIARQVRKTVYTHVYPVGHRSSRRKWSS